MACLPSLGCDKGKWHVETDDTSAIFKFADPRSKFKAAKAKAEKVGVENLSDEDVEGLTPAQVKELRGY